MPSLSASVMHKLLKRRKDKLVSTILSIDSLDAQVAAYRRELAVEAGSIIIGDCQAEEAILGGRPAIWFNREDALQDRVILYLHGGGYVGGAIHHTRNHASDLTRVVGQRVVSLDYRLAPENPYPAALEDTLAAYTDLLDMGFKPEAVTLLGLSAGGGLALAAALACRDAGKPMPGAIVGLSPWCDLTVRNITIQANEQRDIILTPALLDGAAMLYAGDHDRTNPLISPLYGDLNGLPPILLQVASGEMLLGEAIALTDKAKKSGVDVTLAIYDSVWHCWQTLNELLPEARAAQVEIGRFVRRHTWPADRIPVASDRDEQLAEGEKPVSAVPANGDRKSRFGLIHVKCGDGSGKTTSSIGLIMRAVGHGRRAMLVQFLKNGLSGELNALRSLPGIHVLSGPENTRFSNVMNSDERAAAKVQYQRYLDVAIRTSRAGLIDLLVLDEVMGAIQTGMLDQDDVLDFLRSKPANLEVVLTGRDPSQAILELADYVSDIRCVRHPYQKGITAREGIEY